jgi:hypothetical protein
MRGGDSQQLVTLGDLGIQDCEKIVRAEFRRGPVRHFGSKLDSSCRSSSFQLRLFGFLRKQAAFGLLGAGHPACDDKGVSGRSGGPQWHPSEFLQPNVTTRGEGNRYPPDLGPHDRLRRSTWCHCPGVAARC